MCKSTVPLRAQQGITAATHKRSPSNTSATDAVTDTVAVLTELAERRPGTGKLSRFRLHPWANEAVWLIQLRALDVLRDLAGKRPDRLSCVEEAGGWVVMIEVRPAGSTSRAAA